MKFIYSVFALLAITCYGERLIHDSPLGKRIYAMPISGSAMIITPLGQFEEIPEPLWNRMVLLSSPNCVSIQCKTFAPPKDGQVVVIHSNGKVERLSEESIVHKNNDFDFTDLNASNFEEKWNDFKRLHNLTNDAAFKALRASQELQMKAWGYK